MEEELPVNPTDMGILIVLSVVGGVLLASVLITPSLSTPYLSTILGSTMLLAFFLFVPVMGARLFIDDWNDDS